MTVALGLVLLAAALHRKEDQRKLDKERDRERKRLKKEAREAERESKRHSKSKREDKLLQKTVSDANTEHTLAVPAPPLLSKSLARALIVSHLLHLHAGGQKEVGLLYVHV